MIGDKERMPYIEFVEFCETDNSGSIHTLFTLGMTINHCNEGCVTEYILDYQGMKGTSTCMSNQYQKALGNDGRLTTLG